jgi:hypothetical protein
VITELFTGIDQEVLLRVFQSWVNWLKWVTGHEGNYYTQSRKSKRQLFNIGKEKEDMNLWIAYNELKCGHLGGPPYQSRKMH